MTNDTIKIAPGQLWRNKAYKTPYLEILYIRKKSQLPIMALVHEDLSDVDAPLEHLEHAGYLRESEKNLRNYWELVSDTTQRAEYTDDNLYPIHDA